MMTKEEAGDLRYLIQVAVDRRLALQRAEAAATKADRELENAIHAHEQKGKVKAWRQ